MKKDIKNISIEELTDFFKSINEKSFRAKQVYEWLWKKNAKNFNEMTNISKNIREKLTENYFFNSLKIHSFQKSTDKTIKYIFELSDGLLIEGVLIPSKKRVTACVSTQVGCALQCKFCDTGAMGFTRDLTDAEIYEHIFLLNQQSLKVFEKKLTNIVVMGMGEPLMNYKNTLLALQKVTETNGLEMSPSRITLSTVGITKGIRQLADDNIKFNLAISLHTADDIKRSELMPINKTNSIKDLSKALKYFHEKTNSRITIEYILLKEINDSHQDARELAAFCRDFPVKINLIEYNPTANSPYKKTNMERIEQFKEVLDSRNMIVNLRQSRGKDINAACGQLISKI